PIDDRINDQRRDLQTELSLKLLRFEKVEASRIRERMDELRIGQLLDVGNAHLDDRPQIAGKCRAKVSPKSFVQSFKRPHLILGDALRTLEVVDMHVEAGWLAMPRKDLRR